MSTKEQTYDFSPSPNDTTQHNFFSFADTIPPKAVVRELAVQLANYYFQCDLSRNKWSKEPAHICHWQIEVRQQDKPTFFENRRSLSLHPNDIERHLSTNSTLKFEELGLPDPMCRWLDSSIMFSPDFHAPANGENFGMTFCAETNLGPQFPLRPSLDREGLVHTSFQSILLRRVGSLRLGLVATSNAPANDLWFQNFRTLVSECVALIENTLHQVYFKAQFDPLPGWQFNSAALGERHGRRMTDKLKWLYQITGKQLNADEELR